MKRSWLAGYVQCYLIGEKIELFLNKAIKNNIKLWDISIVRDDEASFSISVTDFFKLKPIVRESTIKIYISKKIGLPFLLNKLKKRLGIIIAIFMFLILIYSLSTIVWSIDIEGNENIKDEIIYQTLDDLGIHKGLFKYKLPENEYLQKQLLSKIEEAVWIGVKLEGTNLIITVVEKVLPDENEYSGPCDIVSSKNAIIYKILVEKGISQVKVNDRVKIGDILISGTIGDEENNQQVTAEGTVLGVVWYKSTATVSLKQKWREYTGETYERGYLAIGNRKLKVKGFDDVEFTEYHQISDYKQVYLKNIKLPIGYIKENLLEYELREKILTESEALNIAIEQTKNDLYSKINSTSTIINEKIITKKVQDGKISVEILYEVLEDITDLQPIIQGE